MQREQVRRVSLPLALCYLAVTLPVVGEVIRKYRSGWRPTGDDAVFAVNAHDVFSRHPPFLGTYSVVTGVSGIANPPPVYHLGPLVSWALAIPERFASERLGVVVGAAIVNVVAFVATVALARRLGGTAGAFGAATVLAATVWSIGHATLAEPWNPYLGLWVLPLVFMLAVGVALGDATLLPWLCVAASFVIQAHYLFLGPVAFVLLAVGVARLLRSRATIRKRVSKRTVVWSALALGVCWGPTVLQQLFGSVGNIAAWLRVTSAANTHRGSLVVSVRFMVNVVGGWPAFLRGPLSESQQSALMISPRFVAWLTVGAVVAIDVVAVGLWLRRRPAIAMPAFCAVALLAGTLFTISRYPEPFPAFPYYRVVMVWVAAACLWVGAVVALGSFILSLLHDATRFRARSMLTACAPLVLAIAVGASVFGASPPGPADAAGLRATDYLVGAAKHSLDRRRAVVVEASGAAAFFVAYGIFRELYNDGFHVYVSNDDVQLRGRHGIESRGADRLIVFNGNDATTVGGRVVTRFDARRRGAAAVEADALAKLRALIPTQRATVTRAGTTLRAAAPAHVVELLDRAAVAQLRFDDFTDASLFDLLLTGAIREPQELLTAAVAYNGVHRDGEAAQFTLVLVQQR